MTAGKRQLAAGLGRGERYLVRAHSHPGEPFHSDTDNRNPALTFIGALSVVAPYFGLGLRRGLDACAVLRLNFRCRSENGQDSSHHRRRRSWIAAAGTAEGLHQRTRHHRHGNGGIPIPTALIARTLFGTVG